MEKLQQTHFNSSCALSRAWEIKLTLGLWDTTPELTATITNTDGVTGAVLLGGGDEEDDEVDGGCAGFSGMEWVEHCATHRSAFIETFPAKRRAARRPQSEPPTQSQQHTDRDVKTAAKCSPLKLWQRFPAVKSLLVHRPPPSWSFFSDAPCTALWD